MMIDYLDLLDRAQNGIYIPEDEWDLEKVADTTQEIVLKFNLSWDREKVITDDPGLADAVFEAGLELAERIGCYSRSTQRMIQFSRDELISSMKSMPKKLVMGEGKDTRILFPREICDERAPIVWAGNPGAPHPEHLFLPSVISWAKEPIVDLITCGSLAEVSGHQVRTNDPTEIVATRRELLYLRQALKIVGRPGMGMLAGQSSVSELGDLAVAHPDYLRPCDSHLVPMLNELKVDNRNIARVINSLEYGMLNANLTCVIVGGLGGDAPGSAVVNVASFLLGNLVHKADYQILHPIHIRHVATTTRSVLWVENIVQQAFNRNAPCIIVTDIYPKSGALTEELLFETAANAIVITAAGGHLEGVGSADGLLPNATGLECRLMGEVGHAVAKSGFSLKDANNLVIRLIKKYEHIFEKPMDNSGVRFDEAYNLTSIKPKPEWLKMYETVKAELQKMGLDIN
ncbi:MAG: monomethylamine:corrinoid methyltransferase [Anaerolineales bacterium]